MRWPGFMTSPFKGGKGRQDVGWTLAEGTTRLVRLDELQIGQCGLVCDLDLPESNDNRLRTLGICPGRRVWMVRRGDPMVLKVMGTRLGLAAELALKVTVEVCGWGCAAPDADPANPPPGEAQP